MNLTVRPKKQKDPSEVSNRSETIAVLVGGAEPEWGNSNEIGFIRALNWYSNRKDKKDSKEYTIKHCKSSSYTQDEITKLENLDEQRFKNIGWIARMRDRGCSLSLEHVEWLNTSIQSLFQEVVVRESTTYTQPKSKISVIDKLTIHSTNIINEIEGHIDNFIKTKSITFSPYQFYLVQELKIAHVSQIEAFYKPMIKELSDANDGLDDQLKEAYSYLKKSEIKQLIEFLNLVINDAKSIIDNNKISKVKTPRKTKVVSVDKKISKLIYQKENAEYKLKSINPTNIIGSKELWIFNTKTRKLGYYFSKDDSGLSVKGTSIENYDDKLSVQKTLRKPLDILPDIVKNTKAGVKHVFKDINSVESVMAPRINSDVILIKVNH